MAQGSSFRHTQSQSLVCNGFEFLAAGPFIVRHPLLALAALAVCAGLAVILWIGGLSPWLDVFRQFWGLWVVVAGLGVILTLPSRLKWAKWGMLGVWAAIAAPGVPETLARMEAPPSYLEGDTVRVATHNMWVQNTDPELTLNILTAFDADVLALQESNGKATDVGFTLADAYPHAARCRSTRVLSRYQILESGCLARPAPIDMSTAIPCDWEVPPGVWARVQLPSGRRAVFISTHLTWPIPGDTQSCQRDGLAAALAGLAGDPMVLMGDFNAAAPSLALAHMDEAYGLQRRSRGLATFPSQSLLGESGWAGLVSDPMLIGIDHIYASGDWVAEHIRVGPTTGSDHRPLVGSLILTE